MFERFTDRARQVVVLGQEEAQELGHNYIGTEHILLGLLREGQGVAARSLESLGIRLEDVRRLVQEIIGEGEGMPSGHIPFTPRAKKVLELSLREALQFSHDYIGTEHILLGLVREGDGVAAQVLVQLGADLPIVRAQVIKVLQEAPDPLDVPGEGRATAPHPGRPRQPGGMSVQVGSSRFEMEAITARLSDVVSRLDLIAERLASIEGHLAEGRRPAARAPRKPAAPRRPKQPPAEPPGSGEAQQG